VVTIGDVARHAGVAASTVSYVLSGKRTISAATKERVLASVRELGYRPHAGARALASNRSGVLALAMPLHAGMNLPVLMAFVTSVVTAARSHDHDALLLTGDEGADGLERVVASALVDGLIVMEVELDDPRVPVLRRLDRPSVLIGVPAVTEGLTCVDLDFAGAAAKCVDHLADLDHRRIVLLGSAPSVYARGIGFAQRTIDGFTEAARGRGIRASNRPLEQSYDAVLATTRALLEEQPDLTGLVVHNEAALEPLLSALRALGRRVPEDVSVVAICPDETAQHTSPPLSNVHLPAEELGKEAVTLLMGKLGGQTTAGVTLLPPRLTARASTASVS
jgi:DNA-binding LacI/PurR family transcriptional regulator